MKLFKKRKNKRLQKRCERMAEIILAAALDRTATLPLSKMIGDGRAMQALEELASIPDELVEQLLNQLEDAIPNEYRHLLNKEIA